MKLSPAREWLALFALILLTLGAEAWYFGDVFFHPNQYGIMLNPDGMQITFNYVWQVRHGHGLILSNQNYPSFDWLFMTDAQAAVTLLIQTLHSCWPGISAYSLGIFNGLLLYTIPFCSVYLYKIFRFLGIPVTNSVLFALFICFLSPQWVRLTSGHYGLAYLFFYPFVIYQLLRFTDTKIKAWKPVLSLVTVLLFFGFNNGYLSLAGNLLVGGFGLGWGIREWKQKGWQAWLPFLVALVVLGSLFTIFHGLDHVTDREKLPWGFLVFYAQFESIFLPTCGFIYESIQKLTPVIKVSYEGEAYVGIIGLFFLGWSMYRLFGFLRKRKWPRLLAPTLHPSLNLLLLVSLPILFFSMGYPFRWHLESALNQIPFLKQFRAPGRFAWIFYYVFSIYMLYILHVLLRRIQFKHKWISLGILAVVSLLYLTDIRALQTFNFRYLNGKNYPRNPFLPDSQLVQTCRTLHLDSTHYQALFGIPLCNAWNAKFGPEENPEALVKKMVMLSCQTAIPWLNAKLSRISLSGILASAQLVSHPLIEKKLLRQLPSAKDILIITPQNYQPDSSSSYLLHHCHYLGKDDAYVYYALSLTDNGLDLPAKNIQAHFTDSMRTHQPQAEQLNQDGLLIHRGFKPDEFMVSNVYKDMLLWKGRFLHADSGQQFICSVWNRTDPTTDGSPWIQLLMKDAKGHVIRDQWYWLAHATDIQDNLLGLHIPFIIQHPTDSLFLFVKTGDAHRFERLLIQPADVNIYDTMNGHWYFNNYRIQ